MTSDEALMLEFKRGSRPALDELFFRYRGPLYGFFRRRLDNKERAEDLTQETFLVVIRSTSRYEALSLFRTYLYGIALKLLAAERRKQFRGASAESFSVESFSEPTARQNPDATLWIRQALDKLDESEREILMLREYEQLSYAEIADVLEIAVNTVRSKLFRSRLALRNQLEPQPKPVHDISGSITPTHTTALPGTNEA
jgi:RNA polymerase sigma-70 factor (ECF subfamily)